MNRRDISLCIIALVVGVAVLYLAFSSTAWAVNNPYGNSMTFWTHLGDAMRFRSLPEFQGPRL